MKKLVLTGLLALTAIGYAANEAKFNAVVRVSKPVSIELTKRTLDFGEVVPGATNVGTKEGTKVTISGKSGTKVNVTYTFSGQEIVSPQNIKLTEDVTKKTIDALLYEGEKEANLIKNKSVTLDSYGMHEYTINGVIKNIPSDAEGNYDSGDITIKVMYE